MPLQDQPALIGQVTVGLTTENRVVIVEANIPAIEAGIMMLETAKLELFHILKKKQAEAAERVIETPGSGFDPRKIPPGGLLRT